FSTPFLWLINPRSIMLPVNFHLSFLYQVNPRSTPSPRFPPRKALPASALKVWRPVALSESTRGAQPEVLISTSIPLRKCRYILGAAGEGMVLKVPLLLVLLALKTLE